MFAAFREYSLDVWDWLVGNQYPRQKQLDYLKTTHSLITADLKPEQGTGAPVPGPWEQSSQELTQSEIKVDVKPEQELTPSGIKVDLKPEQRLVQSEIKVDFKPEHWQETHPESSVCITQEAKPRVLTAYTSEHEEF